MTCDEAREAFTDLYDGTLSGPPLTVLSQHLDGCRACRLEWEAFRQAIQALRVLRDEEPSSEFAARVVERIEAPPWWRRAIDVLVFPLHLKLPIHAAALVLVGVVGLWVFQRSPELRQAADVRVPAPAARSVSPQLSTPGPEKTPAEPTVKAKPPAQAPAPPSKAVAPRATAPSIAEKKVGPPAVRENQGAAQLPSAAEEEAPKTLAAPAPSLAKKTEPESAAPRLLRSAPAHEESDAKAESAPQVKSASPGMGKQVAGPPAGTADDLFSTAATEFAAQNYEGAVEHFGAFLLQYPKDRRAPDARFFLAEAYRAQRRYAQAVAEYDAFLSQYPEHRKAPDALYRQGETRLDLGDAAGCRMLRDALNRYPGVREAATAREILAARCP
jgi:tol-pal system protein YbgF